MKQRLKVRHRVCVGLLVGAASAGCASDRSGSQLADEPEGALEPATVDLEALRSQNAARVAELMAEVRALEAEDPEAFQKVSEAWASQTSSGELMQKKRESSLTRPERELIENQMGAAGFDMAAVRFSGRLIAVDDVLFDADDALANIAAVDADGDREKGITYAQTLPGTVNGRPIGPTLFSRCSNLATPVDRRCPVQPGEQAFVQYFRPEVDRTHYVVVPNAPTFIKDLVLQATNEIETITTDDCISNNTFVVVTQTEYNNIGVGGAFAHEIFVSVGNTATLCNDSGLLGCATLPTFMSVTINGVIVDRMALGVYIGLSSSQFSSNSEENRAIFMHELGHTMGLAHPILADGTNPPIKLVVGGSSLSETVPSIMQRLGDPGDELHPSSDDILTFRSLFPAGCSYVHDWSFIPG